jgi:NADPH:quinone reductase-like Zn-dependent oxidoreductase
LNQEDSNFDDELKKVIDELKPLIFFEYIGGDFPKQVFSKMPPKSELIIVGNLTGKEISFSSIDLLLFRKKIDGMFFLNWVIEISEEERQKAFKAIADDLKNGGKKYGSKILKSRPLEEWREALDEREEVASQGKLLITIE